MLAIQVAAGIVLAYVIIVNQKKLLELGGWLLSAACIFVAIVGVIWAGSAAVQMAGNVIPPKVWWTLWALVIMIPFFVLAFTGTLGMLMLGGLVWRKEPAQVANSTFKMMEGDPKEANDNSGCLKMIGLFFLTGLVNFGLSFPVWAFTPIGGWYESIDAYGRANGWDDGLSMIFGAVLWQWVWIPLAIYFLAIRLKARSKKPEPEDSNGEA